MLLLSGSDPLRTDLGLSLSCRLSSLLAGDLWTSIILWQTHYRGKVLRRQGSADATALNLTSNGLDGTICVSVAHSSSGLGYCPLKAETGVRLPYALLGFSFRLSRHCPQLSRRRRLFCAVCGCSPPSEILKADCGARDGPARVQFATSYCFVACELDLTRGAENRYN